MHAPYMHQKKNMHESHMHHMHQCMYFFLCLESRWLKSRVGARSCQRFKRKMFSGRKKLLLSLLLALLLPLLPLLACGVLCVLCCLCSVFDDFLKSWFKKVYALKKFGRKQMAKVTSWPQILPKIQKKNVLWTQKIHIAFYFFAFAAQERLRC